MSRSLDRLFSDFQGRSVKKRQEIDIEAKLPKTVYSFGKAESVLYYCDKRDPGDPAGEGAQGHWKYFIHQHSPGVRVYSGVRSPSQEPSLGARWTPEYPATSAWLGQLVEIEYRAEGSRTLKKEKFSGMNLWVWQDERTLMALPQNLTGKIDPEQVLLWKGGSLKVTGRGIEH